jgi:hypothetical protein
MPEKKYKCAICGKEYYSISAAHLKTHNTTRMEYAKKYGRKGVQDTAFLEIKKVGSSCSDVVGYVVDKHEKIEKHKRQHNMV